MSARSAQLSRLAQQYTARAAAASDAVMRARFEHEAQHWASLARQPERLKMTINGEPVAEIGIKASHLRRTGRDHPRSG